MASNSQRFPRQCRLTRGADILRVRSEGARARTLWFDVRSTASAFAHGRVAVVVPRFDRTAAARNAVKRRLRELVRRELLPTLPALDVVLRASPACYNATYGALREAVRHVAPQLSGRP